MTKHIGEKLALDLNLGTQMPEGVEGYWRLSEKKKFENYPFILPFPVAFRVPGYDKDKFLEALAKVENISPIKTYRGLSVHRWTKKLNGCLEYVTTEWRWPQGYIEYIKLGVPPSRKFYQFIMQEDLEGLPDYHGDL